MPGRTAVPDIALSRSNLKQYAVPRIKVGANCVDNSWEFEGRAEGDVSFTATHAQQ